MENLTGLSLQGVLSDRDILKLHREGIDVVSPFNEEFLQPSSIDLRLGNVIFDYNLNDYILGEKIQDIHIKKRNLKDEEVQILKPYETIFISVYEEINMPKNCMGVIFPRSSITRLGIIIPPIYINPGYKGVLPLTIINHSKFEVKLKPMIRVVQLVLFSLSSEPFNAYYDIKDQKYYKEDVKASELYKDREMNFILENILKSKYPNIYKAINEE